jgi:hypothetical protein
MVTGKPVHVTKFSFSYLIRTDVARAVSIAIRRGLASFPCLNRWVQSRRGRSASAVRHNTAEVKAAPQPGDPSKSPNVFTKLKSFTFFSLLKTHDAAAHIPSRRRLSKVRFPFTSGRPVHGRRVFKGGVPVQPLVHYRNDTHVHTHTGKNGHVDAVTWSTWYVFPVEHRRSSESPSRRRHISHVKPQQRLQRHHVEL